MPETVRATGGSRDAHPRRSGFVAGRAMPRSASPSAGRAATLGLHHLDAYFDAFAELNRSDIVALALTLGVLLFAVVTAIMLVRTRLRAASADAAFRDEIMALKAERDRANALLMSEPQILVSWAAADNEPDILGDTTLVTSASHAATRAGVRHLARAGQGAGHGARGRCAARRRRRLLDATDDARRPRHRGRRPRHRRPRGAAPARRQRAASASLPSSTPATRSSSATSNRCAR